jgi:hypothetical protein
MKGGTGWTKAACCDGKQAYQSAALAADVVRRMKHNKNVKNISSYRCPFCGLWHVGRDHTKGKQK